MISGLKCAFFEFLFTGYVTPQVRKASFLQVEVQEMCEKYKEHPFQREVLFFPVFVHQREGEVCNSCGLST